MQTTNMKTNLILTTIAVTAATATAREIALDQCPQPVRATIEANARGQLVDEIDWGTRDGRDVYVAEIDLPGDLDLKIHVAPDGQLLKIREELVLADAPQEIRSALSTFEGTVDDLTRETEGSNVTYVAEIDRRGQPDLKLVLDAAGRVTRQYEDRD